MKHHPGIFCLLLPLLLSGCVDGAAPRPAAPQIDELITEPEFYDVYEAGTDGYHTYRIPAVIRTTENTLLAFAEARVDSYFDKSENDIVLRRSDDLGVTWGELQVLYDAGVYSLNDPVPVQITSGVHAGRILLMFHRIPCKQIESLDQCEPVGDLPHAMLLMYSDDDGRTWSEPEDISDAISADGQGVGGVGPGIAIVKQREPKAGRIIFPMRVGETNYAAYSDDGGENWAAGALVDTDTTVGGGNEAQIVELINGDLLLNARNTAGTGFRKTAISSDGGETWSPMTDDTELVDSRVMASILRFSWDTDDRSRILFSNPANPEVRIEGTIRLSYDEGQTWSVSKVLEPNIFAYSSLVKLDCRHVGVLFEQGLASEHMIFARFSLNWLTDNADIPSCETESSQD